MNPSPRSPAFALLPMILAAVFGGILATGATATGPTTATGAAATRATSPRAAATPARSRSTAVASPRADFDRFVDSYIAGHYAFRPDRATRDGIHEHDRSLAGFTRGEIDSEIVRLKEARTTLLATKTADLDSARLIDYQILTSQVQSQILDLETVRPWQKDPGYYLDIATGAVHALVARPFAPEPERLRCVIEREKRLGAVLAAAVENLANPPRIWTETALENAQGAVEFFRTTVPAAFGSVDDPALKAEFEKVNTLTVRQMESFVAYLREDLLPVSKGDFRLGPEVLQKKLLYEDMCDIPLFRLERYGDNDIKKIQLEIHATAATIDSSKTPGDLFRVLSIDHPDPDRLAQESGRVLEGLRQFCTDRELVTFPSANDGVTQCRIGTTPEFRRSSVMAAIDAPGPFDKERRDAFLCLTPPRAGWDALLQDEHMRAFNRYALPLMAMHEAYPGHLLCGEWSAKAPTRTRKAFASASSAEGWAFYCEAMVLDQGYEDNDPRFHLFQLDSALLRACRYLAAIRLQSGTMTFDEAVDFFIRQAWLDRDSAHREARRATDEPAYIAGQLGSMQMSKLLEDYRRFRGDRFSLRDFHDRFLASGGPPLRILRQLLMPGDKGTIL